MLRAMLEDRFKLVAHTVPVEVQGYTLVVGKHGLKMKETPPGEPLPSNGMSFGDGSWKVVTRRGADGKPSGVAYYQITMAELVSHFAQGTTPVADQTGLTARYDFELPVMDAGSPDGAAGSAPPPQLDIAHRYDWAAIGLEMKPVKASLLTVFIDHIERPSAN
ncbi:MAG TPA: TIGR03435 family protein, partial [Acidobacteriaceae bacterium]|nr:TIGR03435 family protein [Acidobacteriaceae bacterium]